MRKTLLMLVWWSLPGVAEDPMSLKDAVHLALDKNKSMEASLAAQRVAESRIAEARGGSLPKINYSESWSRSDNPVFVFSSLLTQHQFEEQNFQLGPLNRPDFLNNFQSQVTADQTLYDAGQTRHAIRSAELTKDVTSEQGRRTQMEVIESVIRSYYDAVLSMEQLNVTGQAMHSAEADVERAQAIRSVGMSTDVDVLSIKVHLAGVREQQIRREADLDVASAALNDALGLPLDTPHSLTTALTPLKMPEGLLAEYERNALNQRPEARQLKLRTSLAENQAATAQSSLLPQVGVHAAFEADRQRFYDREVLTGWSRSDYVGTCSMDSATWRALRKASPRCARARRSRSAPVPPFGSRFAARMPICAPPRSGLMLQKHPSQRPKRVFASPKTATKPD